jgi:hypothetical protein
MGQKINPSNLRIFLLVGLSWLVACQNTSPLRNKVTETPVPEPTASEILLTPQPYPLPTASQSAYPLPESSLLITKPVSTLDQMQIMTFSPEQIATQVQPFKERMATEIQGYKDMSDITLDDIGQTFTFTVQSRFFVFLDDDKYPPGQLKCEPAWVMAYISNGSFRGPHRYPDYYEARKIGKCTLRNGDFSVNIVVVQRTPVLPLWTPLPTNAPSYP